MTAENKQLLRDLAWVGLWSTLVSMPIGLWLIPRYRESQTWVPIAALTAAGYLTKWYLLHNQHSPQPTRYGRTT